MGEVEKLDWHILRASVKLVRDTMHNAEVYYAILAISFFWTIGAVLFIQFPPLAKNTIMASPEVASLFLVVFSIGVAIGSVAINALLKGRVSARYSPISVIVMGVFVVAFYVVAKLWEADQPTSLLSVQEFIAWPMAAVLLLCLLGIAIAGGMFVVPLYAFLTTRVSPDKASRTIAANNIVNSGAMVAGSLVAMGMSAVGIPITEQVLLCACMCLFSAWLGKRLVAAENAAAELAAAMRICAARSDDEGEHCREGGEIGRRHAADILRGQSPVDRASSGHIGKRRAPLRQAGAKPVAGGLVGQD